MSYEDVVRLDMSLSLHEKTQEFFGDTYPYNLERELVVYGDTLPLRAMLR